jgi:prepilin-type N-terminal cleavage/methylation domain-containing protein
VSLPRGRAALGDERGLTLAEIILALAVIGIGLVGLTQILPVSASSIQEGAQRSTATFLAEQMIERARAAVWSAAPPVDCLGVSSGDAAPRPAEAACHGATASQFPDETQGVAGHPGFARMVRIEACEAPPGCAGVTGAGLRRVTVTVQYAPLAGPGAAPAPRTVRLEWLASRS